MRTRTFYSMKRSDNDQGQTLLYNASLKLITTFDISTRYFEFLINFQAPRSTYGKVCHCDQQNIRTNSLNSLKIKT